MYSDKVESLDFHTPSQLWEVVTNCIESATQLVLGETSAPEMLTQQRKKNCLQISRKQ